MEHIEVSLICDHVEADEGEAAELTKRITVDNKKYVIDLCEAHWAELDDALSLVLTDATIESGSRRSERVSERQKAQRRVTTDAVQKPQPQAGVVWWVNPRGANRQTILHFREARTAIREWIDTQNGRFPAAADRGRISAEAGHAYTQEVLGITGKRKSRKA